MNLHPAPTDTCSAKCQRAPGAHLRNRGQISIYWTWNGWGCPPTLSQICKSPLSLDFIVDEAVKSLLPHLQDFSVPAVPNSWEKPGFLACLELLMHCHPLDWEGGSQGSSCSWQQKDLSEHPANASNTGWCQVNHKESPQLPSAGGGAVAVNSNGRKWEMLLWERIVVLGLFQIELRAPERRAKRI